MRELEDLRRENEELKSQLRTALKDTERPSVYADIQAERKRQDQQWGGPAHDDEHEPIEWKHFRAKFEHRVLAMLDSPHLAVYEPADARIALVKIAALAVAQIEALDRKTRPSPPPSY